MTRIVRVEDKCWYACKLKGDDTRGHILQANVVGQSIYFRFAYTAVAVPLAEITILFKTLQRGTRFSFGEPRL